jgi:hypothetical protein
MSQDLLSQPSLIVLRGFHFFHCFIGEIDLASEKCLEAVLRDLCYLSGELGDVVQYGFAGQAK